MCFFKLYSHICYIYITIQAIQIHISVTNIHVQIFNLSISKSEFPSPFKIARVIPIHKQGPNTDHTNYRPTAILPVISLTFDRHVNSQLKAFRESNSLFYHRQSGFRQHYSFQTALIKIVNDWLNAINHNKIA